MARFDVQSRTTALHSSKRAVRTAIWKSPGSSSRSSRSIRRRKLANCRLELVQKPTQPSAVGSMDGVSVIWAEPPSWGRPTRLKKMSRKLLEVTLATSSSETSTCSPRPPRSAASAPTAAKAPAAHSITRPPTWYGSRPGRPRVPMEPPSAWAMKGVAGRAAQGQLRP